jgi:hypothetical protein
MVWSAFSEAMRFLHPASLATVVPTRMKSRKQKRNIDAFVKDLESKRIAAGLGKSKSEKVALAHVFARDSTSALLAIKTKHGLTEEQTERICTKVAKDLGRKVVF